MRSLSTAQFVIPRHSLNTPNQPGRLLLFKAMAFDFWFEVGL
jgi:hypothetical protein